MPPKTTAAPKKEKFTDAQAESQCLTYLNLQNRPYNATDIHKNLHEPFSKAVTQKALTALHERNEIICKLNGKTAVYCALQGGGVDTETITALDEEIKSFTQAVQEIKSENKKLSDDVAMYTSSKSTTELERLTASLAGEIESIKERLAGTTTSSYSTAQVDEISADYKKYTSLQAQHTREFEAMFNDLSDALGHDAPARREFRESLGIEESQVHKRRKLNSSSSAFLTSH